MSRAGRLIVAVVAAVAVWLGWAAPAADATVAPEGPTFAPSVSTNVHTRAWAADVSQERAPPVGYDTHNAYNAVDRWSLGVFARSGGAKPASAITYDNEPVPVPVGRSTATTRMSTEVAYAGGFVLIRIGVAAKTPAVGDDLLKPGPWARDSVPSSAPGKITQSERDALNPIGDAYGCHSCGATTPGTKSGNWIGDHQPPSRMAGGGPQVLYPHCQTCSNAQGLWIINLIRSGLL